jgi:16S rRNA (cytosine967-C5)-methyltransferase
MTRLTPPRLIALQNLLAVLQQRRSLSDCLPSSMTALADPRDRALVQALCYGVLRHLPYLQALIRPLLRKPLKERDQDIELILLLGVYQLRYMRIPVHAALAETVELTRLIKKNWATALVNGTLRSFQRQADELMATVQQQHPEAELAHPAWWLEALRADWGEQAPAIAHANNAAPPMTLRVNAQKMTREAYQAELAAQGLTATHTPHTSHGLTLEQPVDVKQLPGFAQGWVSVQDGAAQLAAALLQTPENARVLDACAAPGGKTAHLLECNPTIRLTAVDCQAERTEKIVETLQRLYFSATICCADASRPADWWDGERFDRILLDAPCSASGVIRRHPDIKYLRQATDIAPLVQQQAQLLTALWPLLQCGGRLLYVTCSVFAAENQHQIQRFLQQQPDAHAITLDVHWGHALPIGRQILPGEDNLDGFYYACLVKTV